MAIDNYSDLLSEVADWLNDANITSKVPTFIRMVESRVNRNLRVPDMETSANVLFAPNQSVQTLPDMLEIRTVQQTADNSTLPYDRSLERTSLANINEQYAGVTGFPTRYATTGTTIKVAPTPTQTVNLLVTYYAKVPPLTQDAPTNWLLSLNPEIYLIGCITMAELRGWNDERLPILKGSFDEIMAEMERASLRRMHGGTPLVASTGIRQVSGPST